MDLKLIKKTKIEYNGQELEVGSFKIMDSDLVADILDVQQELDEIVEAEEEKPGSKRMTGLKKTLELQKICMPLAKRGLKRILHPELVKEDAETIDNFEDDTIDDLDPALSLKIAIAMIGLGFRGETDKKKQPTKKRVARKKKSSTGKNG